MEEKKLNTNKLMDMYQSAFQPALAEGEYKVVMLKHEPVTKDGQAPHIRFEFKVVEGDSKDRVLVENRFEAGLGVMVSHLRQQLKKENETIIPKDFFDELIKNETNFSIWIVKRTVGGRQRTNFNFIKPIEETKPNTEVVEDTAEVAEVADTKNENE